MMALKLVRPSGYVRFHDVKFELDVLLVREQPRDAAVVLVAQHDGRDRLAGIVGVIREGADHPVIAARIVHAHERAARLQELVHLRVDLGVGQRRHRPARRLRILGNVLRARSANTGWRVEPLYHFAIIEALVHVVERDPYNLMRPDQHDPSSDGVAQIFEVSGELFFRRTGRKG
jgi:hypothetical protein